MSANAGWTSGKSSGSYPGNHGFDSRSCNHFPMKKTKSTVNSAGNYTKPTMRKRLFESIKSGSKGGDAGEWSARKAQILAREYKAKGGGYK